LASGTCPDWLNAKCQVLIAVFTNLLQERDIMNKKTWVTMLGLCLLGLLLLAGCSKKENTNEEQGTSPTSESKPSQASAPIDSSTAAKVSGTVTFGGAAPKPAKIDAVRDVACKGHQSGRDHRCGQRQTGQRFRLREGRQEIAPSMFPATKSLSTRMAAVIIRNASA
jgi:hypothetical protein